MISRLGGAAIVAAALLAAPLSAKEAAWPEGIYSGVRVSEHTGDMGGLEARFYEEAGQHRVEYVLCEGWCNFSFRAELKRDGENFTFEHREDVEQADGTISKDYVRFVLKPSGKRLIAVGWSGDSSFEAGNMKRISKPFALQVARPADSSQGN